MKTLKYLFIILTVCMSACTDLDLDPLNIVTDSDVFDNEAGIESYMARMYSELPIEDFKYTPRVLFNNWYLPHCPFAAITGEALSQSVSGATTEGSSYWGDAYKLIREANYFIETLPQYSSYFPEDKVRHLLGEAYFIRAYTNFALVKRYGGIPIIDHVLNYPEQSVEELRIPRSSEADSYDAIAADLDYAIENMKETSQSGRANKYVALGIKSRVMLFAGTIAKYNQISLYDEAQNRLCGISAEKASSYFKASYDAAKSLEGKYELYMSKWADGNKEAQFQNFVSLFFAGDSKENIFVKEYQYPNSSHGYDGFYSPRQYMGSEGYGAALHPTLDFVEMFDGIPKNLNGGLKTVDENGKYILFDSPMDIFANAEPRLRATVIFPGDVFKNITMEVRRGIYTGSVGNGINRLLPEESTENYPEENLVISSTYSQTPYTLPDGSLMNPAGESGTTKSGGGTLTGFETRKYLNPDASVLVSIYTSEQSWIELRYAEILLNRAEAAYELYTAGEGGVDYQQDAFNCINQIRNRAGATLLTAKSDLSDVNIIRKERRKELAFENKIWWDFKRWRVLDQDQNSTLYRILMPFYVAEQGRYFLDTRYDERNVRYTFDSRWYYQQIPAEEIEKSQNLIQNPGY